MWRAPRRAASTFVSMCLFKTAKNGDCLLCPKAPAVPATRHPPPAPPSTERAVPTFRPGHSVPSFNFLKNQLPRSSRSRRVRNSEGHVARAPRRAASTFVSMCLFKTAKNGDCLLCPKAPTVPATRHPPPAPPWTERAVPTFRPGHSVPSFNFLKNQLPRSSRSRRVRNSEGHVARPQACRIDIRVGVFSKPRKMGTAYSVPRRPQSPQRVTHLPRRRGQSGLSPLFAQATQPDRRV